MIDACWSVVVGMADMAYDGHSEWCCIIIGMDNIVFKVIILGHQGKAVLTQA